MLLDSNTWNTFVLRHGPRSGRFLQSWEWGEFQRMVGEQVERYVLGEEGQLTAVATVLKRSFPLLGSYWYLPRGPVASTPVTKARLTSLLKNPNAFTLRIEPQTSYEGVCTKTIDLQPSQTILLDLEKSEDELLEGMHHKTRYNIRLAARRGVHISIKEQSLDDVWALFEETGSRGDFRLHPRDYYKKMLQILSGNDCRVFLAAAYFENKPIAATIMIDFGDIRTYLHGASGRAHRQTMAPYLLHWELIKAAKAKGLKWYDWWGVAPEGAKHHPWEGISRFKRGFGGEEVKYPGTCDVILKKPQYAMYSLLRKIRRKL